MRNTYIGCVCAALVATGCTESVVSVKNDYQSSLSAGDDFAALPQGLVLGSSASGATVTSDDSTFYLAINKKALGNRWFLSAFLTQVAPVNANNIPVTALDTKVVSFKVQNDKLYVFDVDDTRAWSDSLDPQVIVDVYPLVHSSTLDKLPNSGDYVVIDPTTGQNKYSAYSDMLAASYSLHFTVDLVYAKRFNKYKDGISFDQVFTGHSDLGDPSGTVFLPENQFTGSGTMTLSLRQYSETPGFTPSPMVGQSGGGAYFFGSKVSQIIDDGSLTQSAVKWGGIAKGQPAKKWVISRNVLDFQKNPALKDYDLVAAIKRGIEGWNQVLGYEAFKAEIASTTDTVGDEDKSFLFIDENPSAGFAFANWRSNPNTGEIRAASIYFSSVWFTAALQAGDDLADANVELAAAPTKADVKAMTRAEMKKALTTGRSNSVTNHSLSLAWNGLNRQQSCAMRADEAMARLKLAATVRKMKGQKLNLTGFSKKDIVERYLTHVVLHEVGHTLGLRHNFKGSLAGSPASSVMDYLDDPTSVMTSAPGTYDTAAVQYLYGQSTTKPAGPFCNDGYVSRDALCQVFDSGADPWTTDVKPWYLDIVDNIDIFAFFFGLDAETHSFARGAPTAAVKADAFDTLMKPARAIDPSLLAQDPFYGDWYDLLGEIALEESYLLTADQLTSLGVRITTPLSSNTQPKAIDACTGIIGNVDKIRTYSSRATCVNVLDTFHTDAALTALKTVRADLDKPENQPPSTASVAEKANFDSLKAKIDRTTLNWIK